MCIHSSIFYNPAAWNYLLILLMKTTISFCCFPFHKLKSWNFNLTSSHKCRFLAIWALEISPGIPRYNGEPNQYHPSGWYSKSGWYFWSNYPWQLMSQNWNILNVLQWVIENGFRVIQVSNSVKNAVFLAWSAPLWWIKNWNVFSIAHKVICSC